MRSASHVGEKLGLGAAGGVGLVPARAQLEFVDLELGEHAVEAVAQLAEFVIGVLARPNRVVLLAGDRLHGSQKSEHRFGHDLLNPRRHDEGDRDQ